MVAHDAAALSETGARPLGIRDGRGGDAAREGRRRRPMTRCSSRGSETPGSCLTVGGAHHERAADRQRDRDDDDDSWRGPPGGRTGRRARARVPGPPRLRRDVRHPLRPVDDRDALVRRLVGDGRPAQPRAAVPAALRHGAGLGARDAAARDRHHGHRIRSSRSRSTPTSTRRAAPTRRACWC